MNVKLDYLSLYLLLILSLLKDCESKEKFCKTIQIQKGCEDTKLNQGITGKYDLVEYPDIVCHNQVNTNFPVYKSRYILDTTDGTKRYNWIFVEKDNDSCNNVRHLVGGSESDGDSDGSGDNGNDNNSGNDGGDGGDNDGDDDTDSRRQCAEWTVRYYSERCETAEISYGSGTFEEFHEAEFFAGVEPHFFTSSDIECYDGYDDDTTETPLKIECMEDSSSSASSLSLVTFYCSMASIVLQMFIAINL